MVKRTTALKSANKPKDETKSPTSTSSVPTTKPTARPTRVREQSPLSLPLIALFLSISLLSLLWTVEAPSKPFAIFKPNPIASKSPIFIRPRILLVTAHPDDEILFAPTVLSLLSEDKKKSTDLWTLCLSAGDYLIASDAKAQEELGLIRQREWSESWDVLGIDETRRWILDIPELKDNLSATWDPQIIANQVRPFVLQFDINTILTFDEGGITQHPNHISIARGVLHMISSDGFKTDLEGKDIPQLFILKTQPTNSHYGPLSPIVKHLSLAINSFIDQMKLDRSQDTQSTSLPIKKTMIYISDFWSYVKAFRAGFKHRSQRNWNFAGQLLWTNYLWVNEWLSVSVSELQTGK